MAAPEEEHKVKVDCAKLIFIAHTLFAPPPQEGETEEADTDGDVE